MLDKIWEFNYFFNWVKKSSDRERSILGNQLVEVLTFITKLSNNKDLYIDFQLLEGRGYKQVFTYLLEKLTKLCEQQSSNKTITEAIRVFEIAGFKTIVIFLLKAVENYCFYFQNPKHKNNNLPNIQDNRNQNFRYNNIRPLIPISRPTESVYQQLTRQESVYQQPQIRSIESVYPPLTRPTESVYQRPTQQPVEQKVVESSFLPSKPVPTNTYLKSAVSDSGNGTKTFKLY